MLDIYYIKDIHNDNIFFRIIYQIVIKCSLINSLDIKNITITDSC